MLKRAFDVGVSATALVVAAPVMAATGIAVKLTSPGPMLFTQDRVGRHGEVFRIHKFRTMVHDNSRFAVSHALDKRITPVGHVLRKTKLDELPQFYDVLRGCMSLVGPRPQVPEIVAKWPADARREILSVRPGITDPATIRYRNEAAELAQVKLEDLQEYYDTVILPNKVKIYVEYVRERGFASDVGILVRTVVAVVRG